MTHPDVHHFLCIDPGYVNLLKYQSPDVREKLMEFQNSLCEMNVTELNAVLSNAFSYDQLLQAVSQLFLPPCPQGSFYEFVRICCDR